MESSFFGSEFLEVNLCFEYLGVLQYKLRMMGIICDGLSYIYDDNNLVICDTLIQDYNLKNEYQNNEYHLVHEDDEGD